MKKRICKSNVQTAFLLLALIVFMFIFEAVSFGKYVKTKAESGLEAFGLIGLIGYTIIFTIPLLVGAVAKFIIAVGVKNAKETTLKKWTIGSVVTRTIIAFTLILESVIYLLIYSGGYVGKIVYCLIAVLEIFLAVKEIAFLKKFN